MSETPETPSTEKSDATTQGGDSAATPAPAKASRRGRGPAKKADARKSPAKKAGARKAPAKRASSRGSSPSSGAPSARAAAGSLASALRELVGGIEEEVRNITSLSSQIDDHVRALNDLRADAAQRLMYLDDLRAAAEDGNLGAFLDDTIQPTLPQVAEDFPPRIYGDA